MLGTGLIFFCWTMLFAEKHCFLIIWVGWTDAKLLNLFGNCDKNGSVESLAVGIRGEKLETNHMLGIYCENSLQSLG